MDRQELEYTSNFGELCESLEELVPADPKDIVRGGFEEFLREEREAFIGNMASEDVIAQGFDESGNPKAYDFDDRVLEDGGYVEDRVKLIRQTRKVLARFLKQYRTWCITLPRLDATETTNPDVLLIDGQPIRYTRGQLLREWHERETERLRVFKSALSSLDAIDEEHRRHKTVVRLKEGSRRPEPWITDACIYLQRKGFSHARIAAALDEIAKTAGFPKWLISSPGEKGAEAVRKRLKRAREQQRTSGSKPAR